MLTKKRTRRKKNLRILTCIHIFLGSVFFSSSILLLFSSTTWVTFKHRLAFQFLFFFLSLNLKPTNLYSYRSNAVSFSLSLSHFLQTLFFFQEKIKYISYMLCHRWNSSVTKACSFFSCCCFLNWQGKFLLEIFNHRHDLLLLVCVRQKKKKKKNWSDHWWKKSFEVLKRFSLRYDDRIEKKKKKYENKHHRLNGKVKTTTMWNAILRLFG